MSTIWKFDHLEDKHTLYLGKDCMKKFCTSLKEQAKNITDFEKKKILPSTKKIKIISFQNHPLTIKIISRSKSISYL